MRSIEVDDEKCLFPCDFFGGQEKGNIFNNSLFNSYEVQYQRTCISSNKKKNGQLSSS